MDPGEGRTGRRLAALSPAVVMAFRDSYSSAFSGRVTPWVRRLLIANTAVFGAQLVLTLLRIDERVVYDWLALQPDRLLLRPWTVLTYAFVHATVFHWFFNMFALFFFGPRLEERWGGRGFAKFYLVAALGGALFSMISPHAPVVGASAAINGLLMAWAIFWPDDEVWFLGLFPVRMLWLVIGIGFFSMFNAMSSAGDGVAHLAHLGGFAAAFAYLKSPWAPNGWGELPPSQKKRRRSPLMAWKAGKETSAVSTAPARPMAPTRAERRAERELLDDVDRILDKISAQGIASLTEEEKQRLHDLSRQRRTN
jgi:membrane associated rhomboid family serine protease